MDAAIFAVGGRELWTWTLRWDPMQQRGPRREAGGREAPRVRPLPKPSRPRSLRGLLTGAVADIPSVAAHRCWPAAVADRAAGDTRRGRCQRSFALLGQTATCAVPWRCIEEPACGSGCRTDQPLFDATLVPGSSTLSRSPSLREPDDVSASTVFSLMVFAVVLPAPDSRGGQAALAQPQGDTVRSTGPFLIEAVCCPP